jgi:hypothetical protein
MTDTRNESTSRKGVLAAGRHPVNVGHLVMGLAFLGLVGIWAVIVNDVVDDEDIRWLLPVPWVLAGLGGLTALAVSGSRRNATRATGWVDTQTVESDETVEPLETEEPSGPGDTEPKP